MKTIARILCQLADTALNLAACAALFYLIFVVAWGQAVNSDEPLSESAPWCAGRSGDTANGMSARHETEADSESLLLPAGPGGIDVPGLWPDGFFPR